MIDILAMLEEKTRGNLTAEERQLIEQVLYELRMRFVEVSRRGRRARVAHHPPLTAPTRSLPARVTFLGTGTSHGVPMIACDCAVCHSTDPRDSRLRTSIYVDVPDRQRILVDTSPDLRQQAITHRHHARGRGDLHAQPRRSHPGPRRAAALQRGAGGRRAVLRHAGDVGSHPTDVSLRLRHDTAAGRRRPAAVVAPIDGPLVLGGVRVVPIPLWHGRMPVLGFRFGRFAYLTDCNRLDDAAWPLLEGVDTLVVDALRERPHPTHFTVAEAVAVIEKVAPRRALLTHMTHDLGHAATSARLPAGVELAYDGLVLDVDVDVE